MREFSIIEADLDLAEHRSAIVELLDSYARDLMGGGRPLSSRVKQALVPGLRDNPSTCVFLAFDAAHAIGIVVCFTGYSTFAAKPLLNIHDIAVTPAYRGKGVGWQLLNAVENKAQTLGCCKLTLEVRQDNHPARVLYEDFGFGDCNFGDDVAPALFLEKRL